MGLALRCLVIVSAVLATVPAAFALPNAAAPAGPSEYQVKGAFIYNFMKFVEWPPAAFTDPLVVGVLGAAPIADLEAVLADKSVRGRRIVVRVVESAGQPGPCHVLFIASDVSAQLRNALRAVAGSPVLTVSDVPDAAQPEAVINLIAVDTRLGFQVNLELAEASGLQVSSKLLGLAKAVRGNQGKRP